MRLAGARRGRDCGLRPAGRHGARSPMRPRLWWEGVRDQTHEFFALQRSRFGRRRMSVAAVAAGHGRARQAAGPAAHRVARRAALVAHRRRPRAKCARPRHGAGGHATLMRARRQVVRGVHAGERRADAHSPGIEAGLRSGRHIQSAAACTPSSDTAMQTQLSPEFEGTPEGEEAQAILRKCVHCGFCNATCPTYQLLGDELDGPRGRIYLIKQVLEGGDSHAQHSAAPGSLPDLPATARPPVRAASSTATWSISAARSSMRGWSARAPSGRGRWLLKEGLTSPLFAPAMRIGPGAAAAAAGRAQEQGAAAPPARESPRAPAARDTRARC